MLFWLFDGLVEICKMIHFLASINVSPASTCLKYAIQTEHVGSIMSSIVSGKLFLYIWSMKEWLNISGND